MLSISTYGQRARVSSPICKRLSVEKLRKMRRDNSLPCRHAVRRRSRKKERIRESDFKEDFEEERKKKETLASRINGTRIHFVNRKIAPTR